MKSKILNVFLVFIIAVLMLVCIAAVLTLGGGVVLAADETASYPVCGENSVHESGTAIGADYFSEESKYVLSAGNYYLSADVTISDTLLVESEVVLCLNGYKLECDYCAAEVSEGGTLTICDCNKSRGRHNYIVQNGKYVFGDVSDESAIIGGVICGGASAIMAYGGVFKMYGGTIAGSNVGISMTDGAEAYIYGGEICGNSDYGIYQDESSNKAELRGGVISACSVGVFVASDFEIKNGKIEKCSTGILVDYAHNKSVLTLTGGEISENVTGVSSNGNIEIGGGTVSGNQTGINVLRGTVSLYGAPKISGNTNSAGDKRNLVLNGIAAQVIGVFGDGAIIGISAVGSPDIIESATGTRFTYDYTRSGNTASPDKVFCADGYYSVVLGSNGEAYLGERNVATLWFTGEGAPQMFVQDGDLYLDTATSDLYKYEGLTESWTKVANIKGIDGANGENGSDGKSAYDIAVETGFEGTLEEWLESLKGIDGSNGTNGSDGKDGIDGIDGIDGKDADSALVIAALVIACVAVAAACILGFMLIKSKKNSTRGKE